MVQMHEKEAKGAEPASPANILLLTTHQHGRGSHESLIRLLISVNLARNSGLGVVHLLLFQSCVNAPPIPTEAQDTMLRAYTTPDSLSLSGARNRLLQFARPHLTQDTLVGFPDDDAWYPDGFLEGLVKARRDTLADFILTGRSASPDAISSSISEPRVTLDYIINSASSNSLFISGAIVNVVGQFDELLGLGARFSGAEDTDFAIRSFRYALRPVSVLHIAVGHDDMKGVDDDRWSRRRRYWPGEIVVAIKHLGASLSVWKQLLRKLALALAMLARREMSAREFVEPIWFSLSTRLSTARSSRR